MKKMKYLLAFSSALLMLVGCTEKEVVISSENELTAIFSPDTRTSYTYNSGTNFFWDTNDEIAIMLDDRTIVKGTLTPYSNPTRAKVTYPGGTRAYHAVYPYSMFDGPSTEYSWSYGSGDYYEFRQINYPSEYDISDIVAGHGAGNNGRTYNTCPLPMYAVNTDGNNKLLFNHFGDLLRVECDAVPAATRKLCVGSSSHLAGHVRYEFYPYGAELRESNMENGNGPVYFAIGTLSNDEDDIILNVPLFRVGYAFDGFKVTAFDSSNRIIRQSYLDWEKPSNADPGRGYKYDVSLNQADENGPYVEISFAGGNMGDGQNCPQSSYSSNGGYPFTIEQFLTSQAQKYIGGVYASSATAPTITNYSDHVKLVSSSLTPYIKITFTSLFNAEPKIIPTKIGIRCVSPNQKKLKVRFNSTANNKSIEKTVPSSISNVVFTPTSSWVSSGLTELYISSEESMDIYSIRFYF